MISGNVEFSMALISIGCFDFFDSHATVVLTHGFKKKSMKTPIKEIERAESYKKEYFNRKKVIK